MAGLGWQAAGWLRGLYGRPHARWHAGALPQYPASVPRNEAGSHVVALGSAKEALQHLALVHLLSVRDGVVRQTGGRAAAGTAG